MGYTKMIKIQIDTDDIANRIDHIVADYIDEAIREHLESSGYPDGAIDDIMEDKDFWNSMIEELMPRLKA